MEGNTWEKNEKGWKVFADGSGEGWGKDCKFHYSLWWLVLCIDLTGLRDAQRARKTLFLMCLWGCLQNRVAFESVDRVKIALATAGGVHPSHWDPEWNEKVEERWIHSLCLSWDIRLLLPLDNGSPGAWVFGLRLNYTISFPGFPVCRGRLWDFLIYIYICMSKQNSLTEQAKQSDRASNTVSHFLHPIGQSKSHGQAQLQSWGSLKARGLGVEPFSGPIHVINLPHYPAFWGC